MAAASSAWMIHSLAQKPTNGGTPAVENINTSISAASNGSRLASPLKSAISSCSKPLRLSIRIMPNDARVVITYAMVKFSAAW